jgi:hypothetical protein
MAKRYRQHCLDNDRCKYESFLVSFAETTQFVFWQRGGGFDRNLWNSKAVHDSIRYIEANPVRSKLADIPQKWPWSSAYARFYKKGLIPDVCYLPVEMPNPQAQRIGMV